MITKETIYKAICSSSTHPERVADAGWADHNIQFSIEPYDMCATRSMQYRHMLELKVGAVVISSDCHMNNKAVDIAANRVYNELFGEILFRLDSVLDSVVHGDRDTVKRDLISLISDMKR